MTANPIKLERVNDRLPSIIFGLSWDYALRETEGNKPSLLSRAVRRLLSFLRHQPEMTEGEFVRQSGSFNAEDQQAARTLWAQREQLANLDAKALVVVGGNVIARMLPTTPDVLDGALTNTGDDVTGGGGGDDERIIVNLHALPERVDTVVLYAESHHKLPLSQYVNPACHAAYMRDEQSLERVDLSSVAHSGFVLAVLKKRDGEFYYTPLHQGYDANDPNALNALVEAQA